jgi:hypothetical protein
VQLLRLCVSRRSLLCHRLAMVIIQWPSNGITCRIIIPVFCWRNWQNPRETSQDSIRLIQDSNQAPPSYLSEARRISKLARSSWEMRLCSYVHLFAQLPSFLHPFLSSVSLHPARVQIFAYYMEMYALSKTRSFTPDNTSLAHWWAPDSDVTFSGTYAPNVCNQCTL